MSSKRNFTGTAAAVLALSAGSLTGQHFVIGTQTAPAGTTPSATSVGIINGPGGASVAFVADSAALVGGTINAGRVDWYSPTATPGTGPLRTITGTATAEFLGAFVTVVPDLDGDGWEDLLVGSPTSSGAGKVTWVSGAVTPPAGTFLPVTLAGANSSDGLGSGAAEIDWFGTRTWVIAGRSTVWFSWFGVNNQPVIVNSFAASPLKPAPNRTVPMVNVGLIDNDLAEDFAYADAAGVRIISGVSGAQIRLIANTAGGFGTSTIGLNTVAGEASSLLIGAPTDNSSTGSVFHYDAFTGSLLNTFAGGAAGDLFGQAVAATDTNADGTVDYLIGAPGAFGGAGSVTAYSGTNNAVLHGGGMPPGPVGTGFGSVLAGFGDIDGNGYNDYMSALPLGARSAYVFSGGPVATVTSVGSGCSCDANPAPRLSVPLGQRPTLGGAVQLRLIDYSSPGSAVILAIGAPIAAGCILVDPAILDTTTYSLDVTGNLLTPPLAVGVDPALMGAVVRAQCSVVAQCGFDYSNALDLRVGL